MTPIFELTDLVFYLVRQTISSVYREYTNE